MSFVLKSSLLGAVALSLAACGGGGEATAPDPAGDPAPAPEATTETPPTETTTTETPPVETAAAETTDLEATPAEAGSPEFADLPEPYKSADYARGKRVFRTCSSCHMLDPEAGNLVGPNLHGMFNRGIGELEGFAYSKALQEADFAWTPEQLDNWLDNPRGFLPGNNMSFSGVRREADRDAVIAYLLVETAK